MTRCFDLNGIIINPDHVVMIECGIPKKVENADYSMVDVTITFDTPVGNEDGSEKYQLEFSNVAMPTFNEIQSAYLGV